MSTPKTLIKPRFVVLDSSHLGAVAVDTAAKDRARQQRAQAFENAVVDSGSVILLCWHHLQELFSYHREEVVSLRVRYLQSLPMVAAVTSFQPDGVIGTIADIQSAELVAAFENPSADVLAVRDEAAKSMVRLCSGADVVRPFLQHWTELRRHFEEQKQRNGEIVAISRSNFAGNSNVKIVDLLKRELRTPKDVQYQMARLP